MDIIPALKNHYCILRVRFFYIFSQKPRMPDIITVHLVTSCYVLALHSCHRIRYARKHPHNYCQNTQSNSRPSSADPQHHLTPVLNSDPALISDLYQVCKTGLLTAIATNSSLSHAKSNTSPVDLSVRKPRFTLPVNDFDLHSDLHHPCTKLPWRNGQDPGFPSAGTQCSYPETYLWSWKHVA
jgi:hypothetical protein